MFRGAHLNNRDKEKKERNKYKSALFPYNCAKITIVVVNV